ncbi:uncharacterized protein LOC122880068 [Siniperca chuatsi]|uniref:uncharacterized protein LOC122880068 n=1 Tax=Siniperca chuatsi TaxID=119488 RepID=UPI001CE1CF9E|nr:uncharacterized protein LOC122880068 [Siniperca chuatsi]
MMEGSGEIKTSATRSADTGSVLSPTSRYEGRAAALRFVAETVLSEREGEEEEEDFCADILFSFINSLEDRQWESIRDRMREPLTQAHLAKVSRRIIRVVSELVFQVVAPTLMVEDLSEASASKSCKLQSHSKEETQSKDSRSSPVMLRPFVEDPLQKYSGVSKKSLDKLLGSSASQPSARSMLGEGVQQVNQAQEQVAEVKFPITKSLRFADRVLAEVASLQDVEQFLEVAAEEVISALVKSLDYCQSQEKTDKGVTTESTARKILNHLVIKMRKEETEDRCLDKFDPDSLDDFGMGYCCFTYCRKSQKNEKPRQANPEVRDGSLLQGMAITYPMTVCSQEVVKDFSCRRFRRTSLKELREFLMRSLCMFSLQSFRGMATSCELHMAFVDFVASEILDTVVNSVNQLCQPQQRKCIFTWQQCKNTTLSEDQVASTALVLKLNLQEKLRNFFDFHKEVLDKVKEGENENERRALSTILSSSSDMRAGGTQEHSVMHSIHSTATGSCKSRVKSMPGVVRSFLDDTEQSLKQDGSRVQSGDEALTRLEELISQDKLFTFSKMLADKLTSMFHQQELSLTESMDASRRTRSDSELSQPTRCPIDFIVPSEQVYLFVEEAVKRLLTSLIFPPPSWGMGHMIQVQSGASSAAIWAESIEKYEAVIGAYSQLMADQVMGSFSRTSAASRLQQEVGGLDGVTKTRKTNIIHFFQELPNMIRRKWGTLTN